MLKKIDKIVLVLTMILSLIFGQGSVVKAASQSDIDLIKSRLKTYFLELDTIDDGSKVETCYVSKAEDYLKLIQADGSFADVDYTAHNNAANGAAWSPYLALDRLQAIAIAYHKQGNVLYQSDAAKDGVDKAIKHWKKVSPTNDNWWERQVGIQLRFSRIGLFMEELISSDAQNIITEKLLEKKPEKHGTGQNNLWFDQNKVYHALLKNDANELKETVTDYLDYCLSTQEDDKTAEAVQVDNSFYMHGKQFYSNGYGMSMFRDMSFWIYILRGTEFAISQDVVTRMGNYMLNGTSWTIRGDIMELYLGYRPYKKDVGYKNYAEEYIEPLKRMIQSDPTRANEYQKVLDNIEGKTTSNGKDGNYYMWRSGYASHMRDGYGINIKMDSKDVIGGEWRGSWSGQSDGGNLVYWTSSAASTVTVDGDEYTKVYPTYDWGHVPGTTTPHRVPADYSNSGRLTNGTNHMIGVSNGKYGSNAYIMSKKDTQATKGYFFFDDEFVALGAGINSKESTAIHTTLNQSQANQVLVDGQTVPTGTKAGNYTGKWIHNDKIGYVFSKETTFKVSNGLQKDNPSLWNKTEKETTPETFTAWVDHGMKPTNDSYEYIVLPNKTSDEVKAYSQSIPVEIIANTKDVQAVRHDGLRITQINFYNAGSLEYKDGYTVSVDRPCSMIIDESTETRKITVAVEDNQSYRGVNVTLQYNNQKTVTGFLSQGAPYVGQSMTLNEGTEKRFAATSSAPNHLASYVRDGDKNTYWQSVGTGEQSLSFLTETDKYIRSLNIEWGSHQATKYDVYGSNDNKNYMKLASIDQTQSSKNVPIGGIYKFIKIVMYEGNGDNYQIKDIKFNDSQLLSLQKSVEVSSTSEKDVENVKEKAVDGSTSTRWSSKRKSNDEWIYVDLGRKAKLDAIEILWEGACSNNYSIEVSDDLVNWKTVKKNLKTNSSLKDQIVIDDSTEGRFIKIHSIESKNSEYGISIYEFNVYGENIKTNIAIGKDTKRSSVYQNNSSNESNKAVDGKSDTKWSSARKNPDYSNQEEWIIIDLKEKAFIDGLIIDWEDGYSDNYSIEISNDNKTWTTIKKDLSANPIETKKHHKDEIIFDDSLEARYVKIHSYASHTEFGINIWEIEVLGAKKETIEIVPEEPIQGENLAVHKNVTTSSVYQNKENIQGEFAVDNNMSTKWSSNRTDDEWIIVDLGQLANINGLEIDWETGCSDNYKIEVSMDNKVWETVKENLKTNQNLIDKVKFDKPLKARYVKVHSLNSRTKFGINIYELQVLGEFIEGHLALNKPSKASSEYIDIKDGNKQYYSSLAFDGRTDKINGQQSRWVSNRDSDDEWIYVDLEDYCYISKIVFNWEGNNKHDYKILVSNDLQKWEEIEHRNDGTDIQEIVLSQLAIGRYVKMQGIKVGGKYGYSLYEFEVYGASLKSDLKAYYDENKNIDTNFYTTISVSQYQEALDKVAEVYKNKDASVSEIINAKEQLKNAIANLVKKANKKALEDEISKAKMINKDLFIQDSIKNLEKVLKEAEKINSDENVTQEEVTKIISKLQKVIDGLVEKANKDNLVNEMKKAESIDKNLYTDKTVKNLEKVLKKAKEINQDTNISQSEVDKMVKSLQTAIKELKEKDKPVIIVPEENKDMTIQSRDQNVIIKGQLPSYIQLVTEILDNNQMKVLVDKVNSQNSEFLKTVSLEKVYQLELLLNGHVYNINDELTISLNIDDDLKDKNLGIVYIDDLGYITKIPSTREGNQITWKTSHLSTYAIVSYNDINEENISQDVTPKTNDSSLVSVYAILLLGSLVAGYILYKKKKED